jgi:GGDEF domain-containing protein
MSHRTLTAARISGGWRGLSRRLRLRLIDYLSAGLHEPRVQEDGRGKGCLNPEDFEDRMRTLFAGRGQALAGRLHFVNMAELHAHYGDRWPHVSPSIFRAASRIISENIRQDDFFTRAGDAFMIVFPNLAPDQAGHACARIAACIRKALMAAHPDAPAFEVAHVVEVVDGRLLLRRKPDIEPTPEFNYRPIWNTRIRQVSSYACLPVVPVQATDGRERAESDRRCLEKIIGDSALLMLTEGRNTNIFFPVHFGTLMDPGLRSVFDRTARTIPPGLKDRLVAEVIDLPTTFERAEILRLKATLSGVAQAMVARVALGISRFHHIKTAGFASVGLDISTYEGPEAKVQSLLDDHVVEASRFALKTYIHGLRSISMITYAVCAGFDHIDGKPISSFDSLPNEIYPLDPKHLYAHQLTDDAAATRPSERTGT